MELGRKLWVEDDATPGLPGHEYVEDAWFRLFNEVFDSKQSVEIDDHGDAFWIQMPNGRIAVLSYQGNSSIHEPK